MADILFLKNLFYENLGPMYLSAVLKQAEHKVNVIIDTDMRMIKECQKIKPDFVAFSCTTGSHIWALNLAKKIKQIDSMVKIIMGGAHPTFFPEVIADESIDIICRGEGERPLEELMNSYDKKETYLNIPNLWIKEEKKFYKNKMSELIADLDCLPFPDREFYPKGICTNVVVGVITSRGCPYSCTFCFNNAFRKLLKEETKNGYFVRKRSIDNVLQELINIKQDYNPRVIQFRDESFTCDEDWLKEFCERYKKEIYIPFTAQVRINEINEKICRALKQAGVHCVFFGVESGNENIRNAVLKKGLDNTTIIENALLLKHFKIPFRTYNILGLPNETITNAFETIYINQEIKTTYPWCSLLQPYKGTEIYHYFEKSGYHENKVNALEWFFPTADIYKNKKEIIALHRLFILAVKFPVLTPLIKRMIKIGTNPLFDLIFLITFGLSSFFSEGETLRYALVRKLKNYRLTRGQQTRELYRLYIRQ